MNVLIVLLLSVVHAPVSLAHDTSCCAAATTEQCQLRCQQTDLQSPGFNQRVLALNCSTSMKTFWTCVNATVLGTQQSLTEVQGGGLGVRQCCHLSPVHRCRTACLTANQSGDLVKKCRKSDNIQFFHCVSTVHEGDECCSISSDPACRKACLAVYSATATSVSGAGSNRTLRKAVSSACSRTPRLFSCAKKLLKVDRMDNKTNTLECCNKGEAFQCRKACKEALRANRSSNEVFDVLVEHCGVVNLTDSPLWQCFLRNSPTGRNASAERVSNDVKQRSLGDSRVAPSAPRISFDAAKLSCCDRGSQQCHQLCRKAYTEDYSQEYDELERCVQHPAESTMASCLHDVEEPCQPGCSNLSFCSSFNNRPLELFRSCSPQADVTAQKVFQEWVLMSRVLLPGWNVKMWGPATCLTRYWKALSCILQLRPCKRNMLQTTICHKDCLKLLKTCMTQANDTLAAQLCNRITPRSFNDECISLDDYLSRPQQVPTAVVVAPCRFNRCKSGNVCIVDHHAPDAYSCLPGCRFGDMSKMMGFAKTWVQFPTSSLACPYNSCNEVCYCNANGELQQCHTPAFQPFESCWVSDHEIDHGTRLQMECNHCICHYGELICTKYHCGMSTGIGSGATWSCPLQPLPVCSSTGKRYLNTCFSQWQSAQQQVFPCYTFTPQCYTVVKLVYSEKQIDRLNRSTNKSTIFTAGLVEQSLRYLLTYLHCRITVYHGIDGELLAVINSQAQSQLHCNSCKAEADKLVMLFERRSPQVTLSVQLDVILLAEVVHSVQLDPSHGPPTSCAAAIFPLFIIPLFTLLFHIRTF